MVCIGGWVKKIKNISTIDELKSHIVSTKRSIKMFLDYRNTFSNYFEVMKSGIKSEYPIESILRNGDHVILRNRNSVVFMTSVHDQKGLQYDITNDVVTFTSIPFFSQY